MIKKIRFIILITFISIYFIISPILIFYSLGYRLNFKNWKIEKEKELESKELEKLVRPCKIKLLRGCVFRQSKPAVVGVIILGGILKTKITLMKKDGSKVGEIKSMQLEKKNIEKAEKDKEIAISIPGVTVGRQIEEDDILLSDIDEEDFKKLREMKRFLSNDEIEILKEIALIKRKENNMWGL